MQGFQPFAYELEINKYSMYFLDSNQDIRQKGGSIYESKQKDRILYRYTSQSSQHKLIVKALITTSKTFQSILNEVKILFKVRHRNIVEMREVLFRDGVTYIVFDEYLGNLRAPQTRNSIKSLRRTYDCMQQICSALKYLHRIEIAHRDIKPQNILVGEVNGNFVYKLTDFGSAAHESQFYKGAQLTQYYAPPQSFDQNSSSQQQSSDEDEEDEQALYQKSLIDMSSDIYELGCLFYELIFRKSYFEQKQVNKMSVNKKDLFNNPAFKEIPKEIIVTIKRMLSRKKRDRPEISEIAEVLRNSQIVKDQDMKMNLPEIKIEKKRKRKYKKHEQRVKITNLWTQYIIRNIDQGGILLIRQLEKNLKSKYPELIKKRWLLSFLSKARKLKYNLEQDGHVIKGGKLKQQNT